MARKWLGSVTALGAIACGLGAVAVRSGPHPDATAAALAIESRLRERAAALSARVTTLSDLPRLAAAVATDAETVRDLTSEELAFRPRPGEVITIAQSFRDGRRVTLLTLPEGAAAATRNQAGAEASLVGDNLILSETARVVPLARADELSGLLTVAWPIAGKDLAAGIVDPQVGARLEIGRAVLSLGGPVDARTQLATSLPIHFPADIAGTARLAMAGGAQGGASLILWIGAGILALLSALAWLRLGRSPQAGSVDEVGIGTVSRADSARPGTSLAPGAIVPAPDAPPAFVTAPALSSAGMPAQNSGPVSATDSFAAIRAGQQRIGRYTIVRSLGVGGMAEVFLARAEGEAGFGKMVAFKILQPGFAALPRAVDLFLDEARLVAGLNHPNIVQTQDLGRAGDRYFIAMEYVDGADLARLVAMVTAHGGRIPIHIAFSILCRICDGLNAAHTAVGPDGAPLWLVHRDVKTANVFVSRAGEVKIGDFGIAKATHSFRVSRTEVGEVKGTPGYMAPEQRLGHDVDRRADVYGVGAIAYEMLSGVPVNLDFVALAARGTIGWPHLLPLGASRGDIPPGLDAWILKALAYDRNDRFADCAEMERALREIGPAGLAEDKEIGVWIRAELARGAVVARTAVAGDEPA